MRHRNMTYGNKSLSSLVARIEKVITAMTSEKPIERIKSLESKMDEVEKISNIEGRIDQINERIWAVKEVLTTAEASAYLGLSESYIYLNSATL